MPTTTPNYGIPIPLDTDPVYLGAKMIRDAMNAVDAKLATFAGAIGGEPTPGLNTCKLVRTTAQSIPPNADTYIDFQAAEFDKRSDNTVSPYTTGGYVCRSRGIYLAVANLPWGFSTTGARNVRIMKQLSGTFTATSVAHNILEPVQGGLKALQATAMIECQIGDIIRLQAWHSHSANLNVLGNANIGSGDGRTSLSVVLLQRT